ncbi:MAG: ABC transporter permease, partial [Anaerolineales bacterium]|nr:ABC transporter permease [Anaerolineales bacterium]
MLNFLIRRTMLAGLTTLAISIIAFVAIQLPPGDYADAYVQALIGGLEGRVTPAQLALEEQIRSDLGLDKPLIVQYLKWGWRVITLDFGVSIGHGQKITEVVGDRLLNTMLLALGTILFTWIMAIPIGIYSAIRHNSPGDYVVTFMGFLGLAVPDFLLSLFLMWIGFAYFGISVGGLYS